LKTQLKAAKIFERLQSVIAVVKTGRCIQML